MRAHYCMLAKTLLQILHCYGTPPFKFCFRGQGNGKNPHSDNEMILTILDEVRHQIGVVFPED